MHDAIDNFVAREMRIALVNPSFNRFAQARPGSGIEAQRGASRSRIAKILIQRLRGLIRFIPNLVLQLLAFRFCGGGKRWVVKIGGVGIIVAKLR